MEALIEMEEVTILAGNFAMLDNVSLRIPLGKTTIIMGPSGCGKSTLIKALAGLIPPDRGSIRVNGRDYRHMSEREAMEFRAWAGFVFQDGALWANQTVLDNVMTPLLHHQPYFNRRQARLRAEALIRRMGYMERTDLRPADLSQGEQKLLGIARAQINDPLIYFMDAPLDLLDSAGTKRVTALIRELKARNKTLILVSDSASFCCETGDWVFVLDSGRLVAQGELALMVRSWPQSLDPLDAGAWNRLEKRGIIKETP